MCNTTTYKYIFIARHVAAMLCYVWWQRVGGRLLQVGGREIGTP